MSSRSHLQPDLSRAENTERDAGAEALQHGGPASFLADPTVLTITVQTPHGTYEGSYLVERASPTSRSLGFVAVLKKVGIVGPDGRYTPLPIATELRGRWQGLTEGEAVRDLTRQFESWAHAQP